MTFMYLSALEGYQIVRFLLNDVGKESETK